MPGTDLTNLPKNRASGEMAPLLIGWLSATRTFLNSSVMIGPSAGDTAIAKVAFSDTFWLLLALFLPILLRDSLEIPPPPPLSPEELTDDTELGVEGDVLDLPDLCSRSGSCFKTRQNS